MSERELFLLSNALNEVANGSGFGDSEFQTRLGAPRSDAERLLNELGQLIDAVAPAR